VRSENTMRYIVYWEWDVKDMNAVKAKNKISAESKKAHPEKYTKNVLEAHFTSLGDPLQGFTITEADTPEQLVEWAKIYWPELKVQFVPCFPADLVKDW
jgi:hypothetical protein